MIHNDAQLGVPVTFFKGTEAEIEALTPTIGMIAYATDTDKFGVYHGTAWTLSLPAKMNKQQREQSMLNLRRREWDVLEEVRLMREEIVELQQTLNMKTPRRKELLYGRKN